MKLMEAIDFNPKESLPKNTLAKKIGMEKLSPFYKYIDSYECEKYAGGSKFRNGDTIMARITPCLENGKTAFVDLLDEKEIAFGSTEFIVMRAKEGITIPEYVYYLAISPWFRNKAISLMTGTSGRQRVQVDPLKMEDYNIPSIIQQEKIVKILSNIDEKIKVNNRINNNLYNIGINVYNEKIVKKGKNKELKDFFEVITGKKDANASSENGIYPFFTCSKQISRINEYSFDAPAILLAGNGDFNVKVYKGKFDAYQRTYVLIPNDELYLGYLYFAISESLQDLTSSFRGSVIKFITKGMIENYKIPFINDKKIYECMNDLVEKIMQNNDEIDRLFQLRDTLLSKLMSGEIDLDNIEI